MRTTKMNPEFQKLCDLEPELLELFEDACSFKSKPDFCANRVWYGKWDGFIGLKYRLVELVGYLSQHPDKRLHTSKAYDIAYRACYYALPDCRHDSCVC